MIDNFLCSATTRAQCGGREASRVTTSSLSVLTIRISKTLSPNISPCQRSVYSICSLPPITNFPNLQQRSSYSASALSNLLSSLRGYSDLYLPTTIIWTLFFTGLVATLTINMLFPDHPLTKAQADGEKGERYIPPTRGRKEETVEGTARKRHTHRNKND